MLKTMEFEEIRKRLVDMRSDHDAQGDHRPTVEEMFAPQQHANALDPNTPIVVGARGAGKSFWAGVLERDDTRAAAAQAYPHLGLDALIVQPGYSGFADEGAVSARTIASRVPPGEEDSKAYDFWQAVILGAVRSAVSRVKAPEKISDLMREYEDPEDASAEFRRLDSLLAKKEQILLVTFDALDTLSRDWTRSGKLIDALFEVVWALRARRNIKAKVFIRPEQLNDESLRFVELPKLRSGRVELEWTQMELYGLLFSRLASTKSKAFRAFADAVGAPVPPYIAITRGRWPLVYDKAMQRQAMESLAGKWMGGGKKKGATYDWAYNHLADAKGRVTPRSFVTLFSQAGQHALSNAPRDTVITAEGIRHGLREASKVRVDQLVIEYKWVKRALAPLARLTVPCADDAVFNRWEESKTIRTILSAADDPEHGFMPPFPSKKIRVEGHLQALMEAMERIGVLSHRSDGRVDIPDLFRVAALMLKRGGTTPLAQS